LQAKVENPLRGLRLATNKLVFVKLKDGSGYIGTLEQSDSTMNLILRDCVEISENGNDMKAKYGRVLIRGSNVLYVSVDYETIVGK